MNEGKNGYCTVNENDLACCGGDSRRALQRNPLARFRMYLPSRKEMIVENVCHNLPLHDCDGDCDTHEQIDGSFDLLHPPVPGHS